MTEIIELAKLYGLPMALVVYYIYRDTKREAFFSSFIRELQGEIRGNMKEVIEANTKSLIEFRAVIAKCPGATGKQVSDGDSDKEQSVHLKHAV